MLVDSEFSHFHFFPNIAHKTFNDWNSNIEIAKHAEQLYKNIDDLELYVGCFFCVAKSVTDIFRPGWATCGGSGSVWLWIGLHNGNLASKFTTLTYIQIHKDVWSFNGSRETYVFYI